MPPAWCCIYHRTISRRIHSCKLTQHKGTAGPCTCFARRGADPLNTSVSWGYAAPAGLRLTGAALAAGTGAAPAALPAPALAAALAYTVWAHWQVKSCCIHVMLYTAPCRRMWSQHQKTKQLTAYLGPCGGRGVDFVRVAVVLGLAGVLLAVTAG